MSSSAAIENAIRRANCGASEAMRRRIWEDAARARNSSESAKQVVNPQNTGRWIMRHSMTKLALAALVCLGGLTAAVVGVNIREYYFEGREADGTYLFKSEQTFDGGTQRDANGVEQRLITKHTTVVTVGPDSPDGTLDVERTRRDLEEIDRLRQQDIRELKWVIDTETSQGSHRTLLYEYTLSDGRKWCRNDTDPDRRDGTRLTTAQWNELHQLQDAGKGQEAGTREEQIKGHLFSFQRQRFVLSDGTEVIRSEGKLKDTP